MLWLIATIVAYFLFAITALVDKHLLSGPIPGPKIYAFYTGILSIFVLFLIPFGFIIPSIDIIAISFLAGAIFIIAILFFYSALQKFEASRIVPCVGGMLPLFMLVLSYLFFKEQISLGIWEFLSFALLVSGSVLISFQKKGSITLNSLKISILIAFLFSLCFILFKIVYLKQPFLSGFIWIRIGSVLIALCFLIFKDVRQEIFKKRVVFKPKTAKILFFNQSCGAGGSILQSWAISLVPLGFLSFISALEGVKYIFLLCLVALFAWKLPHFVKEKMSKQIFLQKFVAVLLISLGLILFVL
jgi:drug/metabolite transporter (DMT)-like permease